MVTGHDITDQQLADLRLRRALSLLQATLDATAEGIMVVDNDDQIVSFNQRLTEMWGVPDAILAAGNRRKVTEFVSGQLSHPEEYRARVERVYEHPESVSNDILEFKDGRVFERNSRPQRVDGETVGRVWCFRDVTERRRLEERLSHQAFHDSLTGLANRALFQDRLRHGAARMARTGGRLAILFVDLDNLKAVNDELGHAAGDAVLQSAARTISSCLRECDSVARLGGDEFGILLEEVEGGGRPPDLGRAGARRPPPAGGGGRRRAGGHRQHRHRPGRSRREPRSAPVQRRPGHLRRQGARR